jgi:hypothetical protein
MPTTDFENSFNCLYNRDIIAIEDESILFYEPLNLKQDPFLACHNSIDMCFMLNFLYTKNTK